MLYPYCKHLVTVSDTDAPHLTPPPTLARILSKCWARNLVRTRSIELAAAPIGMVLRKNRPRKGCINGTHTLTTNTQE